MQPLKYILGAVVSVLVSCMSVSASRPESVVSDANIGGHVVDAETGEHMPYYLVKILGTKLATMTDGL